MKKNLILVDIDKDYDIMMKYWQFLVKHWYLIAEKFGVEIDSIAYQRSTNNHLHVLIRLKQEVDEVTRLHIMLAMGCDPGLVTINYVKLSLTTTPPLRLFWKKKRKSASATTLTQVVQQEGEAKALKACPENGSPGEKNEQK